MATGSDRYISGNAQHQHTPRSGADDCRSDATAAEAAELTRATSCASTVDPASRTRTVWAATLAGWPDIFPLVGPRVGADGLREVRIVGGFHGDDALDGEGELAMVIGSAPEQGRQALTHTHDFGALVEMGIHARHMCV